MTRTTTTPPSSSRATKRRSSPRSTAATTRSSVTRAASGTPPRPAPPSSSSTQDDGKIDGVVSANDTMASGHHRPSEGQRLAGKVPVTGQDASVEGLQNILAGNQCMTVYKNAELEAKTAADLAIALIKGDKDGADALATGPSPTPRPARTSRPRWPPGVRSRSTTCSRCSTTASRRSPTLRRRVREGLHEGRDQVTPAFASCTNSGPAPSGAGPRFLPGGETARPNCRRLCIRSTATRRTPVSVEAPEKAGPSASTSRC